LPYGGNNLARQRRRRHDVLATHEQRIVEHQPQPGEGMADRWLGQVEARAGPADAALGVDRIEHHEQVQIDIRDMHGTDRHGFEKYI
jgi:hypothetical protein